MSLYSHARSARLRMGLVAGFVLLALHPVSAARDSDTEISLRSFHEKALNRESLDVVFFGGSLTWGANASDPQTTSYRGLMVQWLRKEYPGTPFTFHDAAIGGSGSKLGIFRLERDVLAHDPDLVFLDFTVNDGPDGTDVESLASYERIIRELLARDVMVVPVLMAFQWHADDFDAPLPARHQAHIKLAEAYGLPAANVIPYVRQKIEDGVDIATLWPFEPSHPDDPGYRLFFEAVREQYLAARSSAVAASQLKHTVYEDLYPKATRSILVDGSLPEGWSRKKTYRTALWFDGQSSRWMDDVACAAFTDNAGALEVEFNGSMVGLFGERNGLAPPIRVWIDGEPLLRPGAEAGDDLWPMDTRRFAPAKDGSGNLYGWTLLSTGLSDGKHTLRIEPVWTGAHEKAELRIESICSAGR